MEFSSKYHSPYSVKQLHDLVCDVEKYVSFVPWCVRSDIIGMNKGNLVVKIETDFSGIMKSYVSEVSYDYDSDDDISSIDSKAIDGPFSYMHSKWIIKKNCRNERIEDVLYKKDHSIIYYSINMKFKNPIYNSIYKIYFKKSCIKVQNAFEKRSHFLYGNQS